jgi:ADP-ribose pyrophosphatase YjhB (NUDIX family)
MLTYPENILSRLRYQYCPMCATALNHRVINEDGISRVCCPSCGWVHYPSNITGVCTIVKHQEKIVAIFPTGSPTEMPAALPAGHCEYGESPEDAAIREVFEETGLVVEIETCLGWHFSPQPEYPGPNVQFFFVAQSVGGEMRNSEEGRVAAFTLKDLPRIDPSRKGSTRAMQLYLANLPETKQEETDSE